MRPRTPRSTAPRYGDICLKSQLFIYDKENIEAHAPETPGIFGLWYRRLMCLKPAPVSLRASLIDRMKCFQFPPDWPGEFNFEVIPAEDVHRHLEEMIAEYHSIKGRHWPGCPRPRANLPDGCDDEPWSEYKDVPKGTHDNSPHSDIVFEEDGVRHIVRMIGFTIQYVVQVQDYNGQWVTVPDEDEPPAEPPTNRL